MNSGAYTIAGRDYQRAGSATAHLKETLKRIGVEPADMRRAMIASYEAELNVVIHADRGTFRFWIDDGQLDVEIVDEGPGIADIDLAMTEGYSTAPPEARALGFGAGMGLPNMKRNCDRLDVRSSPGHGTEVRFTVHLHGQASGGVAAHSIRIRGDACVGCMRCLHACPTSAIRVHRGRPSVLSHLCIDCTACIETCRAGVFGMRPGKALPSPVPARLVVPAAFLMEFGPKVSPARVKRALESLGFQDVSVAEAWEDALRAAVIGYAAEAGVATPVISPVCPAVVNLIALRFPSLMAQIAPFRFPLEAAREELAGHAAAVVPMCPSCSTALRREARAAGGGPELVDLAALRDRVFPLVAGGTDADADGEKPGPRPEKRDARGIMQVTNVRHDVAVLEKVENGLLADIRILELYACDGGCFGSALLREDAYIGRRRWEKCRAAWRLGARAVRRDAPYAPRSGMRLDKDIASAMEKLSRIEDWSRKLPGRDCGMCGAPTCAAMAEDIVLGRAELAECAYRRGPEET